MSERGHKCDHLKIGDSAQLSRKVTTDDVQNMANISGDSNPIHLNEEYAATTFFEKRIAHGLFCLGMVSNLLGTKLPGKGTVLVNETIDYKRAVYHGDTITTTITITAIISEKDMADFNFICVNQNDELVTDGTARIKII